MSDTCRICGEELSDRRYVACRRRTCSVASAMIDVAKAERRLVTAQMKLDALVRVHDELLARTPSKDLADAEAHLADVQRRIIDDDPPTATAVDLIRAEAIVSKRRSAEASPSSDLPAVARQCACAACQMESVDRWRQERERKSIHGTQELGLYELLDYPHLDGVLSALR